MSIKSKACPSLDISAYIDGELSSADELELECHLAACRTCSDDLNLQKTFLIALESSLDDHHQIELPANFAKSVVASAESGVTGLRRPSELRNAALICFSLISFSLLALGGRAESVFSALAAVADKLIAVTVTLLHFVYDLSLGVAIVFRSLSSNFVFESSVGVLSVLMVFVLSLFLFSKLLVRFHRT